MKKLFLLIFQALFTIHTFSQSTEIKYLSGKDSGNPVEWDFMVTGGRNANEWSKIEVPSNWELKGFGSFNYGHDKNKAYEKGIYKYSFRIPSDWNNKRIFIVFEGAMTDTEVKINGQSAGPVHQGGFYRFDYEITNLLEPEKKNLLEVTVSKMSSNSSINSAERKSDYWVFGGIYRPVYLKAVPPEFISHTAIDAKANGQFTIDVHLSGIKKSTQVEARVIQKNGKILSNKFSGTAKAGDTLIRLTTQVSGQLNWTSESPEIYFADITLARSKQVIHSVREKFGFRTIEVKNGLGIFLNGKNIVLKGCDRHSFRPGSGRALSRKECYDDVMLLKEMNMNAVRMSHYPPDTYFLDLCDEYGIYVLDELAGWQKPPYDSNTGRRLVKEMVQRDVNHPSILFWDNGNEGGWNTDLDDEFRKYDPQDRRVLHPWELFNGIDTKHYQSYKNTQKRLSGLNIYMSTESLHGLYDGGLGAGLDDYWKLMWGKPLNGGLFLWVFADEGVLRTDKNCLIDTDGNHAPDGILGPFHEKEASFYTIKEIWSPVYIETSHLIPADFNGKIEIENRYDFTNLDQCHFEWQLLSYPNPSDFNEKSTILECGLIQGPDIPPREKGFIHIDSPGGSRKADALSLTASDKFNRELFTWTWKLKTNAELIKRMMQSSGSFPTENKEKAYLVVNTDNFRFIFDRNNGMLSGVKQGDLFIPFKNGPLFVPENKNIQTDKVKLKIDKTGNKFVIHVENHPDYDKLDWTIHPGGWLQLDYTYSYNGETEYLGVSFDYPEDRVYDMKWLGKGPYRIWKNRMKGQTFGVWENQYNKFQPGKKWDYPEFPGYYADFSWVVFNTADGAITIATDQEDLLMRVYKQPDGDDPKHTSMKWPAGDISFLHAIPAIGTKFKDAAEFGPKSQPYKASGKYSGRLYFYFGLPE
jgi:hypothetical protein